MHEKRVMAMPAVLTPYNSTVFFSVFLLHLPLLSPLTAEPLAVTGNYIVDDSLKAFTDSGRQIVISYIKIFTSY